MTLTWWAVSPCSARKGKRPKPLVGSPRILYHRNLLCWSFQSKWDNNMWVFPKIGGVSPKMDGENNGKPYQNGWFGGKTHYFRKHPCRTPRPTIYFKGCFNWMMMMNQVFLHRKWNSIGSSRNIHLKNWLALGFQVSPSYGNLKVSKVMLRFFQLSTKQRDAMGDSTKNFLDLQGPWKASKPCSLTFQ